MKWLLVLLGLLAVGAAQLLRVPSEFPGGTKWEYTNVELAPGRNAPGRAAPKTGYSRPHVSLEKSHHQDRTGTTYQSRPKAAVASKKRVVPQSVFKSSPKAKKQQPTRTVYSYPGRH